MNNPIPHFSRRTLWGLIILALILPWIIRIGTEIFYHPDRTLRVLTEFPGELFGKGNNLFFLAVLNVFPVVIFVSLACWRYRIGHPENAAKFFPHKIGIIGSGLVVFGISLYIHLAVWTDIFGPGDGSSTAVLAFIFLPFYALSFMPVGYLIGYSVGWLIGKWLKRF